MKGKLFQENIFYLKFSEKAHDANLSNVCFTQTVRKFERFPFFISNFLPYSGAIAHILGA